MAIVAASTLAYVSMTKRIPAPELEAFARFLQQWVTSAHGGNQTAAGKDLKITQGHISALVRGERGPGLNTLIRLRHKTGATIDSSARCGTPSPNAIAIISWRDGNAKAIALTHEQPPRPPLPENVPRPR